MAYGIDKITAVEAWTTSNYSADDGALDFDSTTCMTNGTLAEDCDEIKEGTISLRIEIAAAPSAITALSVRAYLNSIMTAGENALMPYTDANSVSTTNEIIQDYSSAGQWYNHVTDGAFRAELADLGGYCAVRLSSNDATAKSKLGEINIDITVLQEEIAGITKDNSGSVLGSVKVALFKVTAEGPPETYEFVESQISEGTTGSYSFSVDAATGTVYMVYGEKDDSPHVFDATDNVIQGV